MPSSIIRHPIGRSPAAFFDAPPSFHPQVDLIAPYSYQACGAEMVSLSNAAVSSTTTYPAASRVIAYPFELAELFLVRKLWWVNGTTSLAGNCDVGVYDEAGTTRIVSAGSAAMTGSGLIQERDVTDTTLYPGRYWMAFVCDSATPTPQMWAVPVIAMRTMGCAQMAGSGSTLGTTFTPAAVASAALIDCGLSSRTLVA